MKTKTVLKTIKIIGIAFAIISVIPAHKIWSYFLDDYYNIDNYNIDDKYNIYREHRYFDYIYECYFEEDKYNKITPNDKRKKILSQNLKEYSNERFLSNYKIGDSVSVGKWLNQDIGTLPIGDYISTYEGYGNDSYYAGIRPVTRYNYKKVPKYRVVDYGYGIRDRYQDGWEYKPEPYQDYEPYYRDYTWHYALSTFDISNKLSIFENEDSVYSKYLAEIEKQLKANYDYKSHYTTAAGKKAFVYYTFDGTPIKRVFFCANGRAYLMETKSVEGLDRHSGEACSKINLSAYNIVRKDKDDLIRYYIMFSFCCLIIVGMNYINRRRLPTLNKYAYNISMISFASLLINICIAIYQAYIIYTDSYTTNMSAYILIGSFISAMFISVPLYVYYLNKSKESQASEYIIPQWLKKHIYDKIDNEINKKLYLTFVCYPLMIASLLPLGCFILLFYTFPAIIISTIIYLLNKWLDWVYSPSEVGEQYIQDYYTVLGIPNDATQNDVNVAYNKKMAQINMTLGTSNFSETEFYKVQEAYSVLSSIDKLKPIYDFELKNCTASPSPSTYKINNTELNEYLKAFRSKKLKRRTSNNTSKMTAINILSVVLALALLLCFFDMPYNYFIIIRFMTMVVAAIWAVVFYNEKKTELAVVSGTVALLFQPFVKIALGRTMWNVVDVAVAIALIAITVCHGKINNSK